jgi:hypothetical protein
MRTAAMSPFTATKKFYGEKEHNHAQCNLNKLFSGNQRVQLPLETSNLTTHAGFEVLMAVNMKSTVY